MGTTKRPTNNTLFFGIDFSHSIVNCRFAHTAILTCVVLTAILFSADATIASAQGAPSLVFSKAPIDPANPTNLTTTFNAGDHIYGLLRLDRPLKEFANEFSIRHPQLGYSVNRPALSVEIKINGDPLFSGRHYFVWDLENKDTPWDAVPTDRHFFFDVAPESSSAKTYAYPKMWFGMLSSVGRPGNSARAGAQYYSHQISLLKSGTHKIDFEITGKTMVKGGFTISDGNYAFYNDVANKLDSAGAAGASIPPPKMRNPALEASIRTAVRNAGNRDTPLRVSITNPDWYIQRGPLGNILFRGLFAVIAFRKADGTCYFYQSYFKQDYAGGRYGVTRQDGSGGTPQLIVCSNVTK